MPPYARIAADVDDEEEAALRAIVRPDDVDGDCAMAEAWEGMASAVAPRERETTQEICVSAAEERPLPSESAIATVSCLRCTTRGNRGVHTCGKRRNMPVVPTTATARASRQRTSVTMLLPSPSLARLPVPPLVPDEAQAASSQVVALDAQAVGSCAMPMVTSSVAGGETDADGQAPSTDIAVVASHSPSASPDGARVIGGVHDGNAFNAAHACILPEQQDGAALGPRVLVSREPIGCRATVSGGNVFTVAEAPDVPVAFEYIVQQADGALNRYDANSTRQLDLKARSAADAWACSCCAATGWSIERARICLDCGAPTPMDEAEMTALKTKTRAAMAVQRPKHLGGRRITAERERLRTSAPAQGVYAAAARGGEAEAAMTSEISEQNAATLWRILAKDSLAWLDSQAAMLTLGNQSIARPEGTVQPATIAHVFALAPRLRSTAGTSVSGAVEVSANECAAAQPTADDTPASGSNEASGGANEPSELSDVGIYESSTAIEQVWMHSLSLGALKRSKGARV